MSNTKQPAITLGTPVCFYMTGVKDLLFRNQFRMRPPHRYPLGPYLGVVTDINMTGETVALQVFDASGHSFGRTGVRVLPKGAPIPEYDDWGCCVADMANARILQEPPEVAAPVDEKAA
jgi:hypothetical protein